MRNYRSIVAFVIAIAAPASATLGQSVNIRFGTAATTPSANYAAAGQAGTWNSLLLTPEYAQQPLVNLQGAPIAAQYYQAGSASVLTFNNPLTSGDDEKLMDNMMLSTNSPTDGCFWVVNLTPGPYEVTIYAMTPNNASLMNRTRVDNASPGPTMVGGAWPGQHQQGISYSRFNLTTADGTIAFHDGLYGANYQSGMNGVQLHFLGCSNPTISVNPVAAAECPWGSAAFSVVASGGTLSYQWQIENPPGTWFGMGNDPGPLVGGGFAFASPINSPNVTIGIRNRTGVFNIRCAVTNTCGTTFSLAAPLTVSPVVSGDANGDGVVNGRDVQAFVNLLGSTGPVSAGYCNADLNFSGTIDAIDVPTLVTQLLGA